MSFNENLIAKIEGLFYEKYKDFRKSNDFKSTTAKWNTYIKKYDIKIISGFGKDEQRNEGKVLKQLIDIVNLRNEEISGSIIIRNPDKDYKSQLLLINQEMAQKILVMGLI